MTAVATVRRRSWVGVVLAAAVVALLLATGPTARYPWWVNALVLATVAMGIISTARDLPVWWSRWWSRACLDCGHVYPATEFPGAEPRPACECCQERH